MFIHKLIKVGGSTAITIPKRFLDSTNLKAGDKIVLEYNSEYQTLFVKPKSLTYRPFLTPDFFKWYKENPKQFKDIDKIFRRMRFEQRRRLKELGLLAKRSKRSEFFRKP
jgi:antitoxin component of MazEF toxin-antitoxin module